MTKFKSAIQNSHAAQAVYQNMLRYIHEKDYQIGDRLPTHAQLVKELGTSHATLDTTMKWMCEDGMLTRKQNKGTTVASLYPENPIRPIWQVGIVSPPLTSSYFVPVLTHFLHKHLARIGAADRIYMIGHNVAHGDEVEHRQPKDFPGLENDIDNGMLEAVITSTRLVTDKLPVCRFSSQLKEFAVGIDHKHFAMDACLQLRQLGCKHVLCITHKASGYGTHFEDGIAAARSEHAASMRLTIDYTNAGVNSGYQFARRFLQNPNWKDVDGVIFRDDLCAQAFASILAHEPSKRLTLAVQTNRQISVPLALPALNYAVDIEAMARISVDMLKQKLQKPNHTPPRELVIPTLIEPMTEIIKNDFTSDYGARLSCPSRFYNEAVPQGVKGDQD